MHHISFHWPNKAVKSSEMQSLLLTSVSHMCEVRCHAVWQGKVKHDTIITTDGGEQHTHATDHKSCW